MPVQIFSLVYDEAECRKLILVVDDVCKRHGDKKSMEYREAVAQLVLRFAERDGVNDPERLAKAVLRTIERANQISPRPEQAD